MDDVETAILEAWKRVLPRLMDDQHELAKRLQRRRCASLRRPPRAWCIAVRASDRRIPGMWCVPRAGDDGNHDGREEVYFKAELLRAVSEPLWMDTGGEQPKHLAAKLGVNVQSLTAARCNGT